ncbi:hypothetical protein OHB00_26505 [Streptomyces sp. NBC_00631]|uniref:hypothetical protein n=1 Tax=Streptomyces sp. NBC_00631 TaxID=2975793 RepID=UPI0030E3FA82
MEFGEAVAGQGGEGLVVRGGDPLGEGRGERADAQAGGEARGRVGHPALPEGAGQGRGEGELLERGALPQFGVAGDDTPEAGAELPLLGWPPGTWPGRRRPT